MSRVSLKGICDMHVHTNPDLRLRAYNDLELADAAVRVGARAIVIKSHLGFTVNRAAIANAYVKKVYGDSTNFTMYGGVVMNKVIGGVNPEAVEKGIVAIREGAHIVTDTNMAYSGVSKKTLEGFGGAAHCFMADADVAKEAWKRCSV